MAKIATEASKKITEYINELPSFSKAICIKLRAVILASSGQIVEDWKWGPNYNANGMICGYGGFQKHVSLHFFRGAELKDKHGLFNHCLDSMGSRSIKYTSADQIDEKKLSALIKEAVKLNQAAPVVKKLTKEVVVPDALKKLLSENPTAKQNFEAMSSYKQNEFVEQVVTAKRPETLSARLDKILVMLEASIGWNDKYRKTAK